MERGPGKLQKSMLTRLPANEVLEPYVSAIASLKDYQSTNEELIAASSLLDDCAVLERSTVAYLTNAAGGTSKADHAAVRRALRGLAQRGLAGEWKVQRVQFLHQKNGRTETVSAHLRPGRLSYWFRTGD